MEIGMPTSFSIADKPAFPYGDWLDKSTAIVATSSTLELSKFSSSARKIVESSCYIKSVGHFVKVTSRHWSTSNIFLSPKF
ncbi:hypothetical protein NPIL_562471 [Nephila pilipes]|uniref:Uncharacterized protein n=1 Tax=Nephila pilipes TaxID=299642 RepID=A0A8X6NJC0_NEPPI|nr:hypothetical protein NPIL_562471 [Nephila pilipes]